MASSSLRELRQQVVAIHKAQPRFFGNRPNVDKSHSLESTFHTTLKNRKVDSRETPIFCHREA